MRVVADTNIWVSGLLWRGLPHRLLTLAESGAVELCASPEILNEIAEVPHHPKFVERCTQLRVTLVRDFFSENFPEPA